MRALLRARAAGRDPWATYKLKSTGLPWVPVGCRGEGGGDQDDCESGSAGHKPVGQSLKSTACHARHLAIRWHPTFPAPLPLGTLFHAPVQVVWVFSWTSHVPSHLHTRASFAPAAKNALPMPFYLTTQRASSETLASVKGLRLFFPVP